MLNLLMLLMIIWNSSLQIMALNILLKTFDSFLDNFVALIVHNIQSAVFWLSWPPCIAVCYAHVYSEPQKTQFVKYPAVFYVIFLGRST